MKKGNAMPRYQVSVREDQARKIEEIASVKHMSVSQVIRILLDSSLKAYENKTPKNAIELIANGVN